MNESIRFSGSPKVTYTLQLTEYVCIHCTGKVPSRFHRWMMSKVFGFQFVVSW